MISDNHNFTFGIFMHCLTTVVLLSSRIITRNELTGLHILILSQLFGDSTKNLHNFARQKQLIRDNILNNAPARLIAFAMNTNSENTGSYTENPYWLQQFILRHIKILREFQPNVDFEAAGNCRLYVTAMEVMNFQDISP